MTRWFCLFRAFWLILLLDGILSTDHYYFFKGCFLNQDKVKIQSRSSPHTCYLVPLFQNESPSKTFHMKRVWLALKCVVDEMVQNSQKLKPRPNDRDISTQHIATLSGATCCGRLSTLLRHVAECCAMLGVFDSNLKIVKFFMQHLWILHDAVVVWPGSCGNIAPGHVH